MKTNLLRLVLPLAALGFVAAGTASAQTAIPGGAHSATFVITKPGSYYLAGNRTMSQDSANNIQIMAADVTLDLRGFVLSGGDHGVRIPSPENVEIRNGTIANANTGIDAGEGSGLRIIDLRLASVGYAGVSSQATGTQIDRCQVSDAANFGLYTLGAASSITDCVVVNSGIGVLATDGSQILRTTVRGGTHGLLLSDFSSAQNCLVSEASTVGVALASYSTLRDSVVMKNKVGVSTGVSIGNTTAIIGTRIGQNDQNISGSYINGGGNVLQ